MVTPAATNSSGQAVIQSIEEGDVYIHLYTNIYISYYPLLSVVIIVVMVCSLDGDCVGDDYMLYIVQTRRQIRCSSVCVTFFFFLPVFFANRFGSVYGGQGTQYTFMFNIPVQIVMINFCLPHIYQILFVVVFDIDL